MVVLGDTHAAQGDSELAGTAMETSMTAKLRITVLKAGSLPKKVMSMPFPLLETSTQFVVHGFAYYNYLDDLEDASTIFAEGASLDKAFEDVFLKTRAWMMDTFDLTEEEVIVIMATAVDFGITQVVDGNWYETRIASLLCKQFGLVWSYCLSFSLILTWFMLFLCCC
jgi:acetamidase/formamidase